MRYLKLASLFVIIMMICACSETSLKCNFTSADISTRDGEHCVLAGFAARNGLSDGVHIPLRTNALAITDGVQKVCIISNDVMEISPSLADEIRTEISRRSGLPFDCTVSIRIVRLASADRAYFLVERTRHTRSVQLRL